MPRLAQRQHRWTVAYWLQSDDLANVSRCACTPTASRPSMMWERPRRRIRLWSRLGNAEAPIFRPRIHENLQLPEDLIVVPYPRYRMRIRHSKPNRIGVFERFLVVWRLHSMVELQRCAREELHGPVVPSLCEGFEAQFSIDGDTNIHCNWSVPHRFHICPAIRGSLRESPSCRKMITVVKMSSGEK